MKEVGKKEIGKIAGFIRKKAAGFNGVVLGLSGGLDSSVTAALCTRALGAGKVLALIMPSGGQETGDAEELAKKLKIHYEIVDIEPIVDSFRKSSGFYRERLPLGNLTARIRMCLLYGAANSQDRLVAGTGNRSELLTGYFTRYGDGGADILPLGSLYKTQVIQLAKLLGTPERIIRKEPSAGFWKGQTDEGELGISYPKLDLLLHELADRKRQPEEIRIKGVNKNDIERVAGLVRSSAFKRRLPETCSV